MNGKEKEEIESLVTILGKCSMINYPNRIWSKGVHDSVVLHWAGKLPDLRARVLEVQARTTTIGLPDCKLDLQSVFRDVSILTEIGINRLRKIENGTDISDIDKQFVEYIQKGVQDMKKESYILSLYF